MDTFGATVPNANPYASPNIPAEKQVTPAGFVSELPQWAVGRAAAIGSEADMLVWTIVLGLCFCPPVLLLMFPWYGFRLFSWYQLNALFDELREPNGFSPHSQVAIKFQDALVRLWIGTILGAVFWGIFGLIMFVQIATAPRPQ